MSKIVEGADYPIQPKDIDINRVCLIVEGREIRGLLNTFGHAETEWAAEFIIDLCQKAGRWLAFTYKELDDEWLKTPRGQAQAERSKRIWEFMNWTPLKNTFCFYYLDEGGWVIRGEDGKYRVTEAFIKRCYEKHPTNRKRP